MTHSGQERFMMSSPIRKNNSDQQTKVLEWKKAAYQQTITSELTEDIYLLDQVRDLCVFKLQTHVLGEDLPSHVVNKTKYIEFPAGPWQHFKQNHALSWWMRRFVNKWPVKHNKHTMDVTVTWDQMIIYPWQEYASYDRRLKDPVRIIMPAKINYKEFINNDPTDR